MVVTDGGGKQFRGATVRADTRLTRASWLEVAAAVRVEVSISTGVEDTEDITIGMDDFYILAIVRAQPLGVSVPSVACGIQTCNIDDKILSKLMK